MIINHPSPISIKSIGRKKLDKASPTNFNMIKSYFDKKSYHRETQ